MRIGFAFGFCSLRARRFPAWLIALVLIGVAFPGLWIQQAHASVNLPLHHWAYEAIERLTAMGVIDRAMVVAKPYSRKQATKYVARAIQRIRNNQIEIDGREAVAAPLLERLMKEFNPELIALGAVDSYREAKAGIPVIRYGGRLQVEGDAFSVGHGTVRLRENSMGQYYANGAQVQSDLRAWIEVTDALAVSLNPKYISNVQALGIGATSNDKNGYMQELNAKFTVANIAFQIGRGTNWWGPGYRGSLLLTDHAFPLDMIQLGSDESFKLPWVFKSLGDWKINTFLTQLERDRDFPRAKVFGLRLSYLPASWLELGFTRLTQFGGRGSTQSFPKTVVDAYAKQPNQPGAHEVNEQAMLDFRVRIPNVAYVIPFPAGMQFYGEIGSEDKWSKVPLPSRAAVLGGIYIPQVFSGDSLDLRIEYADTDLTRRKTGDSLANVWYNNGTYQSGMRYRGNPLGHWMGTDGIDLFIRTTRHLTEDLQLGVNLDLSERARGLPVHEKKRESTVDLTWWLSSRTQFTVTYTHQRIQDPGQITSINPFTATFANGVVSNNHLLWTNLAVAF